MAAKISALEDNKIWEFTTLPPGKKALGCKWVYKTKYHADESIERYKARLVVLGNNQVEEEDFRETFASVAKMDTVRCLLTIAASKCWELHQMDVYNAFLHGDQHEDIYETSSRFSSPSTEYGLYIAEVFIWAPPSTSTMVFQTGITIWIHSIAFGSFSVYYGRDGIFLALLIYVNDLVLAGNSHDHCCKFKRYLQQCFKLKDLGPLKYFLGIEVAVQRWVIFMPTQVCS